MHSEEEAEAPPVAIEGPARVALLRSIHRATLLFLVPAMGVLAVTDDRGHPPWLAIGAAMLVMAWGSFSRTAGERALALGYFLAVWVAAVAGMSFTAFSPGPSAAFLVLVLLAGMLFGRRGAWLVAAGVILTYGLMGFAFEGGALHTTSALLDPTHGLNWLRVGLVQAALGLVIALTNAASLKSLERSFAARLRAELAQRKAERALAESQKLEAVGRLAAGVAHDFNNLLTIVSGWTTLIERGGVTEQREGVVAIKAAADRAAQLTAQLLAFARRDERENAATDACVRVRNTAATLARIFPDSVTVCVEAEDGLPAVGISDGSLDQVLLNLSINARDAMPEGGTLTLKVARPAPDEAPGLEGDLVVIRAIDTGTGMSEAVRVRIFEPFFTTKGPGKGTGFGLATVFGIVQAQGGAIDVESVEGKGSTFSVFLPAATRLS